MIAKAASEFPTIGKAKRESFQSLERSRDLPQGWRWVKLGEVMASKLGSVDPSKCQDELFVLYSVPAFDQREPEVLPGRKIGSTKQVVQVGDVLLSKIVPHIRRSWVVSEHSGSRIIASGEWIVFRSEMVWPDYLRHVLVSDDFHEGFMRTTSGVGGSLTRARPALVAKISIPLPPLPEQKRISTVLNEQIAAVDRARKAAEEQSNAAQLYPFALVRESLKSARPRRMSLGDCLDEVREGVGAGWAKYPVLGATRQGLALAKDPVGKTPERYKPVTHGTVFYNPMRILLGSIAMVDESGAPGITSPDYVVVRGKDGILDSRWFYYWFRSPFGAHLIESLSRGAVRERILFNRLAEGMIELPPIGVQKETSNKMRHIAGTRKAIEEERETIDRLPAALLRRAFAGVL